MNNTLCSQRICRDDVTPVVRVRKNAAFFALPEPVVRTWCVVPVVTLPTSWVLDCESSFFVPYEPMLILFRYGVCPHIGGYDVDFVEVVLTSFSFLVAGVLPRKFLQF